MLHRVFNRLWYRGHGSAWLLWPLSLLFGCLSRRRRNAYMNGEKSAYHCELPVIVVGNISVGGTGKTPISIWLIEALQQRGLRPGLVSRGYGGKAPSYPYVVSVTDEASVTGDEPLMIHLRTGVPVVVDPDRASAARHLVHSGEVDVIISDDGLQHYGLSRTIELVVVDGERGFGTGRLLPMGPLREPVSRLRAVDAVLVNGAPSHPSLRHLSALSNRTYPFTVQPGQWIPLNGESEAGVDTFFNSFTDATVDEKALSGGKVIHGLAGIGNPQRFFDTLQQLGIPHQPHSFPDHHDYTELDLEAFGAGLVLTTEKDAVKLRKFDRVRGAYLPINAHVDARLQPELIDVIMARLEAFNQQHRHLY
ncbi:MAG: tetraacyldisaccharide 4'-kinase [Pseudomonadota bacterium]|nr:tetraacyldisaccharide 4'-kinase [Pseudomonadota bacterium]